MKHIRSRLYRGETLLGTWLNLGNPLTAEMVTQAGYDWVIIDMEHGAGTEKETLHQLQAIAHTHAAALVRVESKQRQRVHRVLDMGAEGIMFPHINDPESALEARKAMMYPPEGYRGVAKMIRASGFGRDFDAYLEQAPKDLLGIMQIETQQAIHQVEAIAMVEGVDVLFIGPADLSMDMGIFGQLQHPRFTEAVRHIVAAAEKAHKTVGILVQQADQLPHFHQLGLRFLACSSDGNFVVHSAQQNLASMKQELKLNS